MRITMFGGAPAGAGAVDGLVAAVRQARDDGFGTFWMPQIFGVDALTAIAVVGREVPGIALGTAVVPTYSRHPMVMAQQALTVSDAVGGGRLRLGIGLSHQIVVEGIWGLSFARPAKHMEEYLRVLGALVSGEGANISGDLVTYRGPAIELGGVARPQLLVAALGERMLRLAGTLADGTVTWMTGPATLRDHVVPTLTAAAEAAGRPAPDVVCGLPVCVTDNPERARIRAANQYAIYGQLPSYRAMLDREGAAGPADVAIVGDEAAVRAGIEAVAAAGATELCASEFGSPDELARTRAFLRSLLG
jgi:F420-dependent oxidoreductase-like protein